MNSVIAEILGRLNQMAFLKPLQDRISILGQDDRMEAVACGSNMGL
jgi:hypothetical protein